MHLPLFQSIVFAGILISFYAKAFSCAASFDQLAESTARLDEITSHSGESFRVNFNINGRRFRLTAKRQLEIEARIYLPGLNTRKGNERKLFKADYDGNERRPLDDRDLGIRELVARLIDVPRVYSRGGLRIMPLAFKGESWHGSDKEGYKEYGEGDFNPDRFTSKLRLNEKILVNWMQEGYNHTRNTFLVGEQLEESIYYDTPELALWMDYGVTLRVKKWYPPDFRPHREKSVVPKRFLTLKINRKDRKKNFSLRDEYHLEIPKRITQTQLLKLAKQFLRQVIPESESFLDEIKPQVRIQNHRFGLKLVHREKQVGFMTIDSFREGYPDEKLGRESTNQFEVEFFTDPETLDYVRIHRSAINQFLLDLQIRLGLLESGITREPKLVRAFGKLNDGAELQPLPRRAMEYSIRLNRDNELWDVTADGRYLGSYPSLESGDRRVARERTRFNKSLKNPLKRK